MLEIAVVGTGLVGRAWAIVFARAGHRVRMYDANAQAALRALGLITESLADLAEFGLISETPSVVQERITVEPDLAAALHGAGYVQENALEELEVKKALFKEMDALASAEAILASSTSAIPTSAFTAQLQGRHRCLVAHPVNPPHVVPIVEISPAPWTAETVVESARSLLESVGQVPIIVKREIPGFILNRLQGALLNEAFRLVESDYVSAEDLDKTIAHGLGLRWSFMGPFETIDLNAPGGVADYAQRFAEMYYQMAAAPEAAPRRWSEDVVTRVLNERRKALPHSEHEQRQAWRDRRLMALAAHKRAAEKS
jgi:L-gulonate 3-dehydrogenase